MPDAITEHAHLNDKTQGELLSRYQDLKLSGIDPATGKLTDAALIELLCINRILRKRATAPTAKKATSSRASAPSLDAL